MMNSNAISENLQAYCIACQIGSEREVKTKIELFTEGIEVIVPTKIIEEKRAGKWHRIERPLLLGYIFLFTPFMLPYDLKWKIQKIYKILGQAYEGRQLQGDDRQYAFWLYQNDGCIRPSTIIKEGRVIKVIQGPLLDATGTITRVDKRHRRVWVTFTFDDQERTVSLSASCVEQEES